MSRSALLLCVPALLALACGGGAEDDAAQSPAGAGGSTAGSGGSAGTGGGAAGKGGTAGAAGSAAGGGGASGKGGAGGAGAGGAAGAGAGAGGAGAAGTAGGAGTSGASGAGAAGTAGCTKDADCTAKIPATNPPDCATAMCDKGTCRFKAKDADGDGFTAAKCSAAGGTIEVGNDCDDTNADVSPKGWDGPAGAGKPDHCGDGIDQDCSGTPDDGKTASGATCICAPGDVTACSEDGGGKPVTFPGGTPKGACKKGNKTCTAGGTWGPCIGTIGPQQESCNGLDDDCNGKLDDDPIDGVYFVYDGDDDLRGAKGCPKVYACKNTPPTAPPTGCGVDACATCTGGWKIASAIPVDDCDDTNPQVNPLATELCGDDLDSNCNGAKNDGCPCLLNETQPCWTGSANAVFSDDPLHPTSACKRGEQVCDLSGKWGQCNGQIFPQTELCSPDKDENCDGVIDEGFDVGGTCDVKGVAVGECLGGGAWACNATGGHACTASTAGVGDPTFHTVAGPNGTFDWNCDGMLTKQHTTEQWEFELRTQPSCYFAPDPCTKYTTAFSCEGTKVPRATGCTNNTLAPDPLCGIPFTPYTCAWIGGLNPHCIQASNQPAAVTQGCY